MPAASRARCRASIVDCFASAPFSILVAVLAVTPPSPTTTGLPRLPASPFQRVVPITPADRTGASVGSCEATQSGGHLRMVWLRFVICCLEPILTQELASKSLEGL